MQQGNVKHEILIRVRVEETKLSLFVDDQIIYKENSGEPADICYNWWVFNKLSWFRI